jgi:predicted RNase H-like HicB family nuclease
MEYSITIELEKEDDGRWIAEIPDLPGVMAYGSTRKQALLAVEALQSLECNH